MKTGSIVELAEVEQEEENGGENQFNEMARHGKKLLLLVMLSLQRGHLLPQKSNNVYFPL